MALTVGTRIGPYEIIGAIGAGGMGEVYRARDTKLNRDVAIKILPELFVSDPERVARFQREAQMLAALNHPRIAAIYGLEEIGASRFLVMELVEGGSLAERLRAGRLPIGEALAIARQITDALEAAHERGIIHRDLKPANIMLTADGEVKVLDFGLAKLDAASASVSGERGEAGGAGPVHSPTLTFAATQAGVILGTAAYMSPEQAKGRAADKRSDVWAFGCVLYEMLAGQRAFAGEDISDTLAAILRGEPDWRALPAALPPHIQGVVARCLEKDRRARIPDLSVVRFLMDAPPAAAMAAPGVVVQPAGWPRVVPWTITAAFGVAITLILILWPPWRKSAAPAPLRLSADLGAEVSLVTDQGAAAVLSRDGTVLAFIARKVGGGSAQLYVRRLDQLQATPLSGTDEASNPFFSPDGHWIGFFADRKLKKISMTGGAAVTLADAPNGRGGSWGEDDTIAFTPNAGVGVGLQRVSAAGGKPETLTTFTEGEEYNHRWPQVLPGGKAVLYTTSAQPGQFADGSIVVRLIPNGARKNLVRGGYFGRYLSSGHLIYLHDGTLFAAPFNLDRLEIAGQPVPVLEHVAGSTFIGAAQFAVSETGTIAYLPGPSVSFAAPLVWMDRSGKATPLRQTPANWSNVQISPDGRRLAFDVNDKQTDVWVYDVGRDTPSRLTLDAGEHWKPVWTPDGRRIVFMSSSRGGSAFNLFWQRADGTGEAQRLDESANVEYPGSWHPSGKVLAFTGLRTQTNFDILILPVDGDEASGWKPGKPTVFLSTPFDEAEPAFSPDGRWIAYQSNDSGRNEVYVRPYPGPGGKWQISTDGGQEAIWSRARNELFFRTLDLRIMVASYRVEGDSFAAEKPRLWSEGRFMPRPRGTWFRSMDLHPDGQRFALAVPDSQTTAKPDKLVFIFNFFDELKRLAPPRK